ncbi:unnamed protein product, partial [Pelagomonas calceolata]
ALGGERRAVRRGELNAHLFVRAGLRSLRSLRGPGLQLPEAEPRARAAVVRVSIDVQHAVAGARQGGRHRGLGKRRAHDERVDGRRQVLFGHLRYIATSAFLFTLPYLQRPIRGSSRE